MPVFQKYTKYKYKELSGQAVNYLTDDIKLILLNTNYSPNISSTGHEYLSDVLVNQVPTATGYSGPISFVNKQLTYSGTNVVFSANNVVVPTDALGFNNCRYIALFKDTGQSTTSQLIAYADNGFTASNIFSTFSINFSQSGIFII